MVVSNIDCTEYEDCPVETKLDSKRLSGNIFRFIFVGCWGVYCENKEVKVGKMKNRKWKEEDVLYGEKFVVDGMKKYAEQNSVDAVVLAGDNVYSIPISLLDSEEEKELREGKRSLYDMDKQLTYGFIRCMREVKAPEFLIGLGNHDIENCDVLNTQLNNRDDKWVMPAISYNVVYNMDNFSINLVFIDTNMYDEDWCQGKYPSGAKDKQARWVAKVLKESECDWNIVIGHVPFICNPHKVKEGKTRQPRVTPELFDLLKNHANKIDLYMCADEHNQQYITLPNMPPEVVAGSGGAVQDRTIHPVQELPEPNVTQLAQYTFGFVTVEISAWSIDLTFYGEAHEPREPKKFRIERSTYA